MGWRGVPPFALHSLRLLTRSTRLAARRRNIFNERQQLRGIVGVGAEERRGQENDFRIGDQMILTAQLAAIG